MSRPQVRHRDLSVLGATMYELGAHNPDHDTVINAIMYFKSPLDRTKLIKSVQRSFTDNWRFRATIKRESPQGKGKWILSDEVPDVSYHVQDVNLPCGEKEFANQNDVNEYIDSFYGVMMPEDKPIWIVYNFLNLRNGGPDGDANGAVLIRLHHNLGDGISLMAFVNSFFDDEDPSNSKSSSKGNAPVQNIATQTDGKLLWPKKNTWEYKLHSMRIFITGALQGLVLPLLPADVHTPIKHENVRNLGDRKVATSKSVDLNTIKQIKNAMGGTVNDVLVAALAGVIRRYIKKLGKPIPSGQARAMCLINMRGAHEMKQIIAGKGELGNQFNFLPIDMPLAQDDALERLYHCKVFCDDLKLSPAPLVAYKVNTLGARILSDDQYCQATYDMFNKVTTVFSNVPGPQATKYVCGEAVLGLNFFANSLTATVFGLVSYNNRVCLSVVADSKVVEDPQVLVDCFIEEIQELQEVTSGKLRKPKHSMMSTITDIFVVANTAFVFLYILKWILGF